MPLPLVDICSSSQKESLKFLDWLTPVNCYQALRSLSWVQRGEEITGEICLPVARRQEPDVLSTRSLDNCLGRFGLCLWWIYGVCDSRMVASCTSIEQEAFATVLPPLSVLIASAFLQIPRLSWSRIKNKKNPLASTILPACECLKLAEGLAGLNRWNSIYEGLWLKKQEQEEKQKSRCYPSGMTGAPTDILLRQVSEWKWTLGHTGSRQHFATEAAFLTLRASGGGLMKSRGYAGPLYSKGGN